MDSSLYKLMSAINMFVSVIPDRQETLVKLYSEENIFASTITLP